MQLSKMLLLGAVMASPLLGQVLPAQPQRHLDVAVTYDATRSNAAYSNSFWMQGGSVQLHAQFYHGLGIVADIAGSHASNIGTGGVGPGLVTATFGPRYTWTPARSRISLFGQGLIGEANGFDSVFPSPSGVNSSTNGLALLIGGGVNVTMTRHLALRGLDADWLRTELPNGSSNIQNNLRLGAGVVLRFQ